MFTQKRNSVSNLAQRKCPQVAYWFLLLLFGQQEAPSSTRYPLGVIHHHTWMAPELADPLEVSAEPSLPPSQMSTVSIYLPVACF